MEHKEKKEPPKFPSFREIIKGIYRDVIDGIKAFKKDIPNMRKKLKNPVKTQYELGLFHAEKGNITDARFRFWITTLLDKTHQDAWYRLGWACYYKGKINKAKKALQRALKLRPNFKEAQFWLDIINEKKDINQIPLQIIKEDANRWADMYEQLFLIDLEYVGYETVSNAVLEDLDGKSVLDLGCGTGLCGELLRQKAERIVGVDISRKMVKRARNASFASKDEVEPTDENNSKEEVVEKKDIHVVKAYDEVVESDIISYLKNTDEQFDAIVGAYIFNFFSDLSELLALCKRALHTNGKLAFSVECADGEKYSFASEVGMFVHSDKYIRKTLDENGFKVLKSEPVKLYSDCLNGVVYTCQLANDAKQ